MTVVYIDLLFLLNLTANYFLLLGTCRVGGVTLNRIRIALGACVGALYAVLVFLPGTGWMNSLYCKASIGVLMVFLSCGKGPRLMRCVILFFIISAALAGMVLGAELLGNTSLMMKNGVFYSPIDIRLLLLLFVLFYFIFSFFFRRLGHSAGRNLVELEIILLGERLKLVALKDSGHTLMDPVHNRTVVIAYYKCLPLALLDCFDPDDPVSSVKKCRECGIKGAQLISYRAVGVNCGLLVAVKAEAVFVGGKQLGSLLIAMSPNPVDDGEGYQALIGGDV